jgi:hypothetical protein
MIIVRTVSPPWGCVNKWARQSGSTYVRDVLVLANRCDFILIETAKAEAVFQ